MGVGLRTVGLILWVYIRCRDRQMVGYRGCIGVACPWSAGDIVYVDVDVVLRAGIQEMRFLECVRVASGVRCGRRGGRDRCGGGEGGEGARAGHGGGGRWRDGAFIMCIQYVSVEAAWGSSIEGFKPQPHSLIGLTQDP